MDNDPVQELPGRAAMGAIILAGRERWRTLRHEATRQPRYWITGLVALLTLVIAVGLVTWAMPRRPAAPAAPDYAGLARLPARPADIEAHGTAARSVLSPEEARRANAARPLTSGELVAARPFKFRGSDDDRARALECLATAALYEAGDDTKGEAAVAQVVLNRVRHPAFPKTVCGVVYQGAERATGCQFTFTCDGSLRRRMPEAAWKRAREVAEKALDGRVDETVGLATHYHTDWVLPYWSPQLNKLARVDSHLFFGWPGAWGGSNAFQRRYLGGEPLQVAGADGESVPGAELAADPTLQQPDQPLPAGHDPVPLYGNRLRLVDPDGHAFGLVAPAGATASQLVSASLALCQKPGPCQVAAWSNGADVPASFPISPAAREKLVFEFNREQTGDPVLRFDCTRFPNRNTRLCF